MRSRELWSQKYAKLRVMKSRAHMKTNRGMMTRVTNSEWCQKYVKSRVYKVKCMWRQKYIKLKIYEEYYEVKSAYNEEYIKSECMT